MDMENDVRTPSSVGTAAHGIATFGLSSEEHGSVPAPLIGSTPEGSGQGFELPTAGIIEVEEDEYEARRKATSFDLPTAWLFGRMPASVLLASDCGSPFLGHPHEGLGVEPLHVRFQVFRI